VLKNVDNMHVGIKTVAAGRGAGERHMPPNASRGAPKWGAVFFATRNIQKSVSSVSAGMGVEGQIMFLLLLFENCVSTGIKFFPKYLRRIRKSIICFFEM